MSEDHFFDSLENMLEYNDNDSYDNEIPGDECSLNTDNWGFDEDEEEKTTQHEASQQTIGDVEKYPNVLENENDLKKRKTTPKRNKNISKDFYLATRMNFLKEEAEGTQGVDISEIHEKDIVEIISRAEIEETTIMKLQEKFNKMPENTTDPISNKAYFNLCSSKLTNQLASANWKRNKRFIYLHYKIKEMKEKIDKFTKNVLKDNLQMDQNDDEKKIETLIETFKNENEEFIASLIVESYNLGHDDDQKSLIRSNWRKAKLQKRELGWLRSGKAKAKKYDIEKSKYEDILKKMNE